MSKRFQSKPGQLLLAISTALIVILACGNALASTTIQLQANDPIDMPMLIGVIDQWKQGNLPMSSLLNYIGSWETGQPCQTCAGQSGFACSGTESCSGSYLIASDAARCCNIACGQASTIPSGYVAWWRFEGNADDYAGNYDGVESGNPTYVSGLNGQALEFDGSNDFVNIGAVNPVGAATALSVSLWVKAANPEITGQRDWTFFKRDSFWLNHHQDEMYSFGVTNSSGTLVQGKSYVALPDTAWHHLVGVWNGANVRLYVDGILGQESSALTGTLGNNSYNLYIGSSSDTWDGIIDNVMIYGRALNETEIQQINNAQGGSMTCIDATGCSSTGSFCDAAADRPYTCSMGAEGCLVRENHTQCGAGENCEAGQCVADPCYGIGSCDDYDSGSCSADSCDVSEFGCEWTGWSCAEMPDPCTGISSCDDYSQSECSADACDVSATGSSWNSGSGICEIYVPIVGDYIIADHTSADAFTSIPLS